MLVQLASSNAVQLAATFAAGGLGYLLAARWPLILALVGFTVAALLAVSFLFDVGEVYSYATLYKRAFWYLTDNVTTWLTPLMMWAILSRRRALAIAVACGILFSGTKISLFLLLLQYGAILLISRGQRRAISLSFWTALAAAGVVYVALVLASPHVIPAVPNSDLKPTTRGCIGQDGCLVAQVSRPAHDRGFSAVAGVWMTLQGGFPGERYPETPEKFADLMVKSNPWGINDTFGITRDEWIRMGTVQTPYLQFGAGYGPVPLALLLAGIAAICVLGAKNIIAGERGPFVAFTIFFIVNAIFNQTQPWLTRGAILFLVGFCAAHILARYMSQRSVSRVRLEA